MKPPYEIPTMADISGLPSNGYNVVSTFSGCGGSCLGYRMAGYKVLWANEFIPEAARTYAANHPNSILDTRDIRIVTAEEILTATNLQAGEIDIFDGSPPCASFSTAGKRESTWGKVKQYSDTAQRTDDLFFEYIRLVKNLQPRVFVAENVSGLVKGTAKGYFIEILAELKKAGYDVKAACLNAAWLGVPQARQRIIFIGVRNDFDIEPVFPKPLDYQYSVRDALVQDKYGQTWKPATDPSPTVSASMTYNPWTSHQRLELVEAECDITRFAIGPEWDKIGIGNKSDKYFSLVRPALDKPCPTVTQTAGNTGAAGVCHPTEKRKFSIAELKRICSFPSDFVLTGTYAQQWERLGRSVPPLMMRAIASTVRDQILRKL